MSFKIDFKKQDKNSEFCINNKNYKIFKLKDIKFLVILKLLLYPSD